MKELIEIEFVQQKAMEKMHVTSNPYFAFHDDVFPGFSKNAASQRKFPRTLASVSRPHPKAIIPFSSFSSLAEFKHISTFEMDLRRKDTLQFQIDFEVPQYYWFLLSLIFKTLSNNTREVKILECQFFDRQKLFTFGLLKNGSVKVDSDFVNKTAVLALDFSKQAKFELTYNRKLKPSFLFIKVK